MTSLPPVSPKSRRLASAPVAATPVRLQLSRKKGSRLVSPNGLPVVVVTRPGPFGNPFDWRTFGGQSERAKQAAARDAYELFIEQTPAFVDRVRRELRGKNLACWCPMHAGRSIGWCHADILLALAAAPAAPRGGHK